jgi:DNA-binding transcriptional regulator LsrR (DeoR family)
MKRPVEIAQLRLIAKVARMYHEGGVRQPQIATELNLSQARVSRLLRQASEIGVVRTVVTLPPGVYTDLEERLQRKFSLRDAVIVDADGARGQVIPALGAAAAQYLHATLTGGEVLGVSSWSATLLAAAEAMPGRTTSRLDRVVQIVGGHGDPSVQVQANRLTGDLAAVTGAQPVLLPAPALVSSPALRRALVKDPSIGDVMKSWKELDLALVGIGSLEPSPLLRQSGNALTEDEQDELRSAGAVGDVCLRFFDVDGCSIETPLNQRILNITPADLMGAPRRVGVAGGAGKYRAIRAALRGGWVNVLVTDLDTARGLVEDAESPITTEHVLAARLLPTRLTMAEPTRAGG